MSFSERLKELRKEKDLKQSDLKDLLGTSIQSISAYENGREPDFKTLIKLSEYFDVSVDYLVGASNNRRNISEEKAREIFSKIDIGADPAVNEIVSVVHELIELELSAPYNCKCLHLYSNILLNLKELQELAYKRLLPLKNAYPEFNFGDFHEMTSKEFLAAMASGGAAANLYDQYLGSVRDIESAAHEVAHNVYRLIAQHLANELIGKKEKGAD